MAEAKISNKRNRPVLPGRQLLLAGGALGAIGYGVWQAGRVRFNPKINGKLQFEGLLEQVEVIRDRMGVPHIFAGNQSDLFFAQGFVQAQDRFWQLELQRRLAAGRLAEIFGPAALEADRFLRRVELYRQAEKSYNWILQHEDASPLQRFAEGVNAFLALNKLPLEVTLLRYKPEPWTPVDSLGWSNVMTFGQSSNFWTELARAEVVRAAGPELAAKLEPWPQPGHPLTVPPEANYEGVDFETILAEYSRLVDLLGLLRQGGGSNNWVVDGSKSVTGKPLLSNDPHPALQMPGVFYAMHLDAPGYSATGATVPGLPGVIIGHNGRIAWGFTNTMADFQDAFIEKTDPLDPRRYLYKGEWLEFESHIEEIRVKGASTVRQEQFRSVHGPIISEFSTGGSVAADGGSVQGAPVAMRWSVYDQPFSLEGLLAVGRATNWQEFRAALKRCPFPSLNFVYADTEGNIGYQFTGLIPIRAQGLGLLPVPGHSGEYDWTGYIPFEELPGSYNPASHFLLTANNRIESKNYPYHLSADYANGARAERIRQLLTEKEKLSVADFERMQADLLSINGLRFARLLVDLEFSDAFERRAQALLTTWDGRLTAESVAGCIYEVMLGKLLRLVLEPQLGRVATNHYLGVLEGGFSAMTSLYSLAGPHFMSYIEKDDKSILPEGLTWEEALRQALKEAVRWLRQELGDDVRGWEWGKIHTITFSHFLGIKPPLDRVFNRGPYPAGGDSDTIFQTAYAFKPDQYTVNGGTPAWRMIVDLADPDNSKWGITGGQNGSPFNAHYSDMIEPWLRVEFFPMPFSRHKLTPNLIAGVLLLEKKG
ncbi:MAG TPA: penicillin acylase family protein [Chloroflexia bacterium]|nr:penicillin acylase family protein [Chloroflexia bacterium]